MAFSNLEKAMALVIGLDIARPGPSRAAAKASTSYGKKGVINDSKKAFKAVTKEASRIKKGGKLANKGIRRKIGQAIRKVFK